MKYKVELKLGFGGSLNSSFNLTMSPIKGQENFAIVFEISFKIVEVDGIVMNVWQLEGNFLQEGISLEKS